MLQYVLCASRFAHYLKVILREEVGRVADAHSIEAKLDAWLSRYTLGNDDADLALRRRYPLRLATVSVRDQAGKAGVFTCSVRLQPHFQLDDVDTSFQLIAETAAIAGKPTPRVPA
jgi:type VI secretion system protein ImpD